MAKSDTFQIPHTLGIIGDPIGQSLSPQLHRRMATRLNLPYTYISTNFPANRLKHIRRWMQALDIVGLNVTAPHKIAVIRYLDRVAPCALACGSVNTIVWEDELLVGYNTDGEGALDALRHTWSCSLTDMQVTIIGAGGAARAIAHALSHTGASHIHCLQRSAKGLAAMRRCTHPRALFSSAPLTKAQLRDACQDSQLVIQASSAPLRGKDALPPCALTTNRPYIMDIRYAAPNPWLANAQAQGARISDGYAMLIAQAARSFELWTKQPADLPYWRRIRRFLTVPPL